MGAEYLFYMKSIEAHARAFLALIILGIGTVVSLIIQFILFQKEDITIRLQLLHLHQIRVFMKPIIWWALLFIHYFQNHRDGTNNLVT